MNSAMLLVLPVIVPAVFGLATLALKEPLQILRLAVCGVFACIVLGSYAVHRVFTEGPVFAFADWLFLDALSAYHVAVMLIVYGLSSLFALSYFGTEVSEGRFTQPQARLFGALWSPSLAAMVLVLISNNLGIMWVGMESTTLLTAFLICVPMSRGSLEAMWKYILICSVGIAFAFVGTLLIRLAARDLPLDPNESLLWTKLLQNGPFLDVLFVKAAFIFVLVGYGTKAGLAPMHSWLPDAHSKAPAPVSAIFSGFMLNAALYCILRYVPIVEEATGRSGWPLGLLVLFGLASIVVAGAFIMFQHDIKRLFAYSSVEHLGIIALGFGLGGAGTFAALLHMLNHSLCKSLSFCAAGRLGQLCQSHDMGRMAGSFHASRLWSLAILGGLLALVGLAPFGLFISELQVLRAALEGGRIGVVIVFLLGTAAVFVGAVAHALPLVWGESPRKRESARSSWLERSLALGPLVILLCLGLGIPGPLEGAINKAAMVLRPGSVSAAQSNSGGGK